MIAVKKSEKVKVVSQVMEWQGKSVLDIRTHVVASKGDQAGSWIPTGKGVQVPAEKAVRFLELALEDAKAKLHKSPPRKSAEQVRSERRLASTSPSTKNGARK